MRSNEYIYGVAECAGLWLDTVYIFQFFTPIFIQGRVAEGPPYLTRGYTFTLEMQLQDSSGNKWAALHAGDAGI